MAYASVTYTSASGTTFALTNSNGDPIPYIRQSDIKVYVNNVLQTVTTDYTFNTAGTAIVLNSPVSGATVLLQRITDITDPTVVYTAGSTLTAQDLNNADNQIRYGLQEFQDSVNAGGGVPDGDKGDITVAGNGTIWTIDSGAVVEAKIASGAVTSAKIADGTIVNADINASAAIAHSKLANITAGSVLLGDASNVPTATALSGDVTVDSSGVTAIGSGVIVDADINNSAAIALSKLATGALPTAITVASANIVDGTIVDADINANAEIAVSKLADGTARQLLQTDAAGNGVEWTSNVDIPGTLDVTGAAVFDSTAAVSGDVTIADKIIHAGDTDTAIRFPAADVVAVETSGSERCRVDSSGRLLVGTSTAPTATESSKSLLVVNGNISGSAQQGEILLNNGADISGEFGLGAIYFGGESNGQVGASINAVAESAWNTGGDTTDSPGRLVFSTTADGASSPTERMRISQTGGIYMGRTTGGGRLNIEATWPSVPIDINVVSSNPTAAQLNFTFNSLGVGNIVSSSTATAYNTSSDYRLKENVVEISDAIQRIKQLAPKRFNFIIEPSITVDGFIAHEVQPVVPEAITGEKDAVDDNGKPIYQGIDQSKLVPLLTAALQEAVAKIEVLEAKVAALEAV